MMSWLDSLAQNNSADWLYAGTFLFLFVGGAMLIRHLASRYLTAMAARTSTKIDDLLVVVVHKTNLIVLLIIGLYLAQKALALPVRAEQILRIVTISAVFLQFALWGNAVISYLLAESSRRAGGQEINISARRAMAYLGRFILWILILALLLENLGVRLTPLLAGIGIGGIAIALAIQNILGDLFCYVAIILDKPFIAGDFLIVGDLMGTVERIGLKTTRIRALSGELLIFANHDLVNSRVRNYQSMRERRVVFRFGVTYETPLEKLRVIPGLVRDVFASLRNIRLDRVHFAQLGDFSLNFEVVYYVLTGDYNTYMDLHQEVNLALMQTLEKEEIEFAYPTQTLHIRSSDSFRG